MNPSMGSNELNMKQLFLTILSLFCIISSVFADGTKQFMPNKNGEGETPEGKGQCYLALGSREGGTAPSREFARYNEDGTSCGEYDRLYIRIADCTTEKIYLGIGGILFAENPIEKKNGTWQGHYTSGNVTKYVSITLKYRLKMKVDDDSDISPSVDNGLTDIEKAGGDFVVWGDVTDASSIPGFDVPKEPEEEGYIENYVQAYYGPKVVDSRGYEGIEIPVSHNGLYYLEFYIGSNRLSTCDDCKPIDFKFFDVSVVGPDSNDPSKMKQLEGRVYSRSWGLTTNGATKEAWSTFYTYSTDHYTSKVYLGGVMPYRFVFCCNSFGSTDRLTPEENRKSLTDPNKKGYDLFMPEYKIFTTSPDTKFYGEPSLPNLPQKLSFAGDAMTCEDLIFVMKLLNREDATIELYLNDPSDEGSSKVLIDVLKSKEAEERGYHFPWKNDPEIKIAGSYYYKPEASGCERTYKLSLFDQRIKFGNDYYNIGDTATTIDMGNINEATLKAAFVEDLGSENNPILISTADQLQDLATAVETGGAFPYMIPNIINKKNDNGSITPHTETFSITNTDGFSGVHFYITAKTGDIVLGSTWNGIGTSTHPFKGTMRCGKYKEDPEEETPAQYVGDQDTITINGSHPLFNYCENATIDNIHVKGNIALHPGSYVSIPSETNRGGCGGICGYANNTHFTHCSNAIVLKQTEAFSTSNALYTGGIIGYSKNCTIDSCSNKGAITTIYENGAIGGIVGFVESVTTDFCYNVGLLNSAVDAGGICGKTWGNNTVKNCKNINSVASSIQCAGGIIGSADGDNGNKLTINDCFNSGTITSDAQQASGIVGLYFPDFITSTEIKYCLNNGAIGGEQPYAVYAIAEQESDGNGLVTNCLSIGEPDIVPAIYITTTVEADDIADIPSNSTIVSSLGADHFFDDNGTLLHLHTMCCGSTWRNEEAGRLYKADNTFYLSWDGKFDNGECVVGEVTVNYQKNTGVTHFPFYDPENIKSENAGLVVYRIAPIETEYKDDEDTYEYLPKDYYQTSTLSTERGIEMKLYWDDTNISMACNCTHTTNGIDDYTIGQYDVDDKSYCISYGSNACKKIKINYLVSGKTTDAEGNEKDTTYISTKYACESNSFYPGKSCVPSNADTVKAITGCRGISNVARGGYYGSHGGGHIFPVETPTTGFDQYKGFGNNHIINTWWNGIEKKGQNTLHLKAYEPAILMPIIISKWIVTNLSESVLLEWTTSSEENNSYFIVERSTNGRDWEKIGKVLGAGTASTTHSYSLEDTHPVAGISYYRLKQTDFNGEYSYSSVKCVNRPKETEDYMTIYTNANTNTFVAEGESIAACTIEVHDILGHKITNISFNTINPSKVAISVENLPVGTYIVTCCNKSKTVVKNWK